MSGRLASMPFSRADSPVHKIMATVILALLPATLFGLIVFGWPVLYLFTVTVLAALLSEALCLRLAGRPVRSTLMDGSALLTGWLVALTMPPCAPWWTGVIGSAVAIIVGKQVFGGLGQNLFNPAMLARVTLLISFPLELTTWSQPMPLFSLDAPGLLPSWSVTFGGGLVPDGYAGATPLGFVKTEFSQGRSLSEALHNGNMGFAQYFFGWHGSSLGEASSLLLLGGGLYLLQKKVISWHIPLALLGTVALLASAFWLWDGERYPGPLFHLTSGAVMLGAFFIATDYVTSPNSPLGQVIFGAGCGLLIFVIRTWGAYPEGVAFAVLLMNATTPLIDHYIRPRIYGRDYKGRPLEVPESGE